MSDQPWFRWRWFVLGAVLGTAGIGFVLSRLAALVPADPAWPALVLVLLCLLPAVADLRGRKEFTFPARQTYSGAVRTSGVPVGLTIWGFDLALGFTTYRSTRAYWVGITLLAVSHPMWWAFIGTAGYSSALLASIHRKFSAHFSKSTILAHRRRLGLLALLAVLVLTGGLAVG
ncbi:MAG TPA: hypothetical protein VFD94_06070 [Jatrophihabitans sp.]|nr:hypothetical protein [Jatrophihabitans sp.]